MEKSLILVIQARSERLSITNPGGVPESAHHKAEMQKSSDILINNVGYHFDCNMRNKSFHKALKEDFERFIDVDLKGIFMVLEAAIAIILVSEAFTSATYNMVVTHGGKVLP